MKVIKVENQVEGGKVAFEILKKKLANGAQTLGLATAWLTKKPALGSVCGN